jgi:hypothetical protein
VLVNNAGIMPLSTIADTDDATFGRLVDVNLKGTFNTLREAARRLRDGGRIINFSSHIVANRLDACPSWRHATEKRPGGIRKTVGLAVAAAEQKFKRLVGQILHRDLSCIGFDRIRQAAVADHVIT